MTATTPKDRGLREIPELRWLDRHHWIPAVVFGGGVWRWRVQPRLSGDILVSTVLLYHATFCINSLAHVFGSRRFDTPDQSRNNWFLALLTFGEGWHNNHHFSMASCRQGFRWWEVDITYVVLKVLSYLGIARELRPFRISRSKVLEGVLMRIAIIGSGISGLAAGWYLSRKHEVILFEKDTRLGGHTNTVMVENGGNPIPVDTGFIVHNDRTYPNLVRLLSELGVETQPSDMSFSVSYRTDWIRVFEPRHQRLFCATLQPPAAEHYLLLAEILRFNRTAPKLLDQPGAESATVGDVIDDGRYHESSLIVIYSPWPRLSGPCRPIPFVIFRRLPCCDSFTTTAC